MASLMLWTWCGALLGCNGLLHSPPASASGGGLVTVTITNRARCGCGGQERGSLSAERRHAGEKAAFACATQIPSFFPETHAEAYVSSLSTLSHLNFSSMAGLVVKVEHSGELAVAPPSFAALLAVVA